MIPKTMKAAVLREFGRPLTIEELPVREPKEGEILIKVVASGVCHTDLPAANGQLPLKPKMPLVLGHEVIGYVVAVGANVKIVKEGDVVGVPWLYQACGHCNYCTTGWESICLSQVGTGYVVDGGHAEYMIADANYVAHFPDGGFDFYEMAPILCAGVTVYKGLKVTDVHVGQWVAISGVGGLGHLAIQYAKAMGLRVAAIDVAEEKLELAKKVGADIVLNADKVDAPSFLLKETGGMDGMLVTAANVSAFDQGFHALKRGATLTCVGIAEGKMSFPVLDTVVKAITIRGSVIGNRWDVQEAIDLAVRGKVKTVVTKAALDDINQVFDKLRQNEVIGRMVLAVSDPV